MWRFKNLHRSSRCLVDGSNLICLVSIVTISASYKAIRFFLDNFLLHVFCFSLSGQTPFSNERHGKTMDEQIKSGHFVMSRHSWENVTESAKDIVKEMMTLKAESRITIPNIFKHPWLQVNIYHTKYSTFDSVGDGILTHDSLHETCFFQDPIMIATVEKLIPKPQSLDKQGVKLPSKGKENVPNPASQEVTTCDNFSSSPKSAALVLMSPPFPPPKRRKTVR